MSLYTVSPLALEDLDAIHGFIEDVEGADATDRLVDALYDSFEMIAANPGLGHRRPDLT